MSDGTHDAVPASELVIDDDGHATRDGAPFSGLARSVDEDGVLLAEETWRDGVRHGPARLYHPCGALAEEGERRHGAWHGTVEVWNPDGSQAEEAEYAYGICLQSWTWDADGEEGEHFQLDPDSDMMALVERCRAEEAAGDDAAPRAGGQG